MGELHPDSLFPYRLRTNPFRILLRGFCFLYSLFCHGYSFRNPPEESRFQTRNHVWFYVDGIRSFSFCSGCFSSTIWNIPDRPIFYWNRLGYFTNCRQPLCNDHRSYWECRPTNQHHGNMQQVRRDYFSTHFRSFNFKSRRQWTFQPHRIWYIGCNN